ncbi:MAG: tRNA 2-thiouridine(34) synthase MnmA [Clostridia bacterium]|nr:tRNA 2-thiouridine(34) synthase MnmA [Clostridia bacterium]
MQNEKILIAMSGGVDSSVAALLLQESGKDCVGATMRLFSPALLGLDALPSDDIGDARRIAEQLGMPFHALDLSDGFCQNVIDYFIRTYMEGGTPNPCVQCNRTMKFGKLLEAGRELGCDAIATGHYAKIAQDTNGRWQVSRAADLFKDQTYVLWQLSQEQLAHTYLPLGNYTKEEIREIAEANGFCNAQRRDSQDICFIPDGDYVGFIERYTGKRFPSGNFIDRDGNILGKHNGMIRYTIGQRKGLGIAFGKPTYVCAKNAKNNTVTLGDNSDLFRVSLTAHAVNLIATERLDAPIRVQAKVRYAASPAWATAEQTDTDTLRLSFDEPQRAICAGQSVVLYDGNTLIGGGIID